MPPDETRATDDIRPTWDPTAPRRFGYFFRASGLIVEQQNDGRTGAGQPIGWDTGGGVSLAVGYRFGFNLPLTLEGEWAYRRVNAASGNDGELEMHTLAFNVLFDAPDLLGPVGVYAGGGIGVGIDRFAFSSGSGGSSTAISGSDFYWQLKAGLSVSITEKMQILGGVVWQDAGTQEDGNASVEAEFLGAEIGIRFFF